MTPVGVGRGGGSRGGMPLTHFTAPGRARPGPTFPRSSAQPHLGGTSFPPPTHNSSPFSYHPIQAAPPSTFPHFNWKNSKRGNKSTIANVPLQSPLVLRKPHPLVMSHPRAPKGGTVSGGHMRAQAELRRRLCRGGKEDLWGGIVWAERRYEGTGTGELGEGRGAVRRLWKGEC